MKRDVRCDVAFVFQAPAKYTTGKLPAHKLVLANSSPVFEAMFFGSGANMNVEKDKAGLDIVTIGDIDQDVFDLSLDIIYGSIATNYAFNKNVVEGTCYMADKYDIECLRMHCEKYLCKKLTDSNGDQYVSWAIKYHLPELKIKARARALSDKGMKIITKRFDYMDPDTAIYLLSGGDLPVHHCKTVIFAAVFYIQKLALEEPNVKIRQNVIDEALKPLDKYLLKYCFLFSDKRELYPYFRTLMPDIGFLDRIGDLVLT